jgi:hypothetical protein
MLADLKGLKGINAISIKSVRNTYEVYHRPEMAPRYVRKSTSTKGEKIRGTVI